MTILDKILAEKYKEVEKLQAQAIVHGSVQQRPSLYESLKKNKHLQVIAEIKRASPSKGIIQDQVCPVEQAIAYEKAGAACISVLTDTPFFKGSFEDLERVAEEVTLPLLCKDFIVDEVQIDYAKAAGASVILLIVAALDDVHLNRLHSYARQAGLEVLVEVHDVQELQRALQVDAKIIGVNNRDLKTFTVDLARTEEIAAAFPFHEPRVFISESGILERADAERVSEAGAHGILVGESLMRAQSIADTVKSFAIARRGQVQ